MAQIKLENIVKRFGDVVAVRDFNLEIQDKEFVVFLGPSGCGKTTTLRVIAGLEHPEEGDVLIDGNRVNDLSPADRDIAFVFQFYALYPHLRVYDNIAFPLKAVKVAKSEIDVRVKKVADILHITDILDRKPSVLSGGEMQRVALGRAMVRQPKVYLLDEPMANLDAKLRIDTRAEIKRLQHEIGATTIFVTHDQIEAMSLADRIAVIHQGLLQQVGTPHEIYNKPQNLFVAGFMGMPTMNLLDAEITTHEGSTVLQLSRTDVRFDLSTQQQAHLNTGTHENSYVFGVRPEHIKASKEPFGRKIAAEVHLIEPLGSVNILDLTLGTNQQTQDPVLLRVRTHPMFQVESGDTIWLDFDDQQMHLFNKMTEQSIWINMAKKIPCRMAAFDLDGTLLNSNHEVSPENKEALQHLEVNGVLVVLVSGRMHRSIKPISDLIGLKNPIISYNGGMVKHAITDEVYHHTPVPAEYAIAVVNDCAKQKLHLNYCLDDALFVAERNKWSELYETRTGVPASPIGNLQQLDGKTPTKLLVIHPAEKLAPLLERFKSKYIDKLYVTQTQPEYIEFMNPDVTKGNALIAISKRFDIPIESVVAFGDSYNDESLLKTAGFGIAMANAVAPIKACADYITTHNDDNGVAKAIWELIL